MDLMDGMADMDLPFASPTPSTSSMPSNDRWGQEAALAFSWRGGIMERGYREKL
jgi:hypothetical protein